MFVEVVLAAEEKIRKMRGEVMSLVYIFLRMSFCFSRKMLQLAAPQMNTKQVLMTLDSCKNSPNTINISC